MSELTPEEQLKGLGIEEIQAYLEKLLKEAKQEQKNTGEENHSE